MFMPLIDECFNHEAAVLRGEPWQPKTRQNASNFFSQTIERRAGSRAALLFCSLLRLRLQVAGPVLWSVRLRGVRRGLVSQALPWHEHSYVDTRALASWSSKNGRALERAPCPGAGHEHEVETHHTKSHTCICMVVSSTDTTSGGACRASRLCARVCFCTVYTRELKPQHRYHRSKRETKALELGVLPQSSVLTSHPGPGS